MVRGGGSSPGDKAGESASAAPENAPNTAAMIPKFNPIVFIVGDFGKSLRQHDEPVVTSGNGRGQAFGLGLAAVDPLDVSASAGNRGLRCFPSNQIAAVFDVIDAIGLAQELDQESAIA